MFISHEKLILEGFSIFFFFSVKHMHLNEVKKVPLILKKLKEVS